VDELDLNDEDFRRVLTACRLLRLGEGTPAYLREFLARRLDEASREDLAARLRQFSEAQMGRLSERIRQRQGRDRS
jgi:hypothetical protein